MSLSLLMASKNIVMGKKMECYMKCDWHICQLKCYPKFQSEIYVIHQQRLQNVILEKTLFIVTWHTIKSEKMKAYWKW